MIAVLFGTRPEFIKLAPVIKELELKKLPYILIHSGQHYSDELNKNITDDLILPKSNYTLNIGSGSHAEQTGKIMIEVERVLKEERPKILVVHGDTNTMLAGSLAAKKLHIAVAHVEAGLRSFDNKMPEEINRIITDKISDILFAPTKGTKENLLRDGIAKERIFVTGNTIVDALRKHFDAGEKSDILEKLGLKKNNYILVTAHRTENVDDINRLKQLILLFEYAISFLNREIIWPIHPHTYKRLKLNKIKLDKKIKTFPPINYLDMLTLINFSHIILTDSGGIQEEAYILKKWLITLRESTERPETLTANFLVGLNKDKLKKAIDAYRKGKVYWKKNVFGKGNSGQLIVKTLVEFYEKIEEES
ncbi:UDP-N-acetylglucosamine 2-epimerase (non-hydrolyzing) [Candidatus Daviesbacteria bacterium]|nr:UDP-N-acetylglucosamine 2-epimerase (non-hydrolyzing) [Candidatus Daviesbacteria bacterium]